MCTHVYECVKQILAINLRLGDRKQKWTSKLLKNMIVMTSDWHKPLSPSLLLGLATHKPSNATTPSPSLALNFITRNHLTRCSRIPPLASRAFSPPLTRRDVWKEEWGKNIHALEIIHDLPICFPINNIISLYTCFYFANSSRIAYCSFQTTRRSVATTCVTTYLWRAIASCRLPLRHCTAPLSFSLQHHITLSLLSLESSLFHFVSPTCLRKSILSLASSLFHFFLPTCFRSFIPLLLLRRVYISSIGQSEKLIIPRPPVRFCKKLSYIKSGSRVLTPMAGWILREKFWSPNLQDQFCSSIPPILSAAIE